ncbi:MAG: flagellar filament capping protein FliD [Acidobacteriia bacterium]|nr:flagellar filament capping protein FliD [Terriglobia bacterium]
MSTTSSLTAAQSFTGVSQYASDFQAVLTRAVQIAQIPVTQLQSRDTDILSKKTLLGSLNSAVSDFASSLSSLGQIGANKAIGATSSDSSLVTVSATGSTSAASYTINSITSVASAAAERSATAIADAAATPVSTNGTVTLQYGSTTKTFQIANNNLTSLRDQINGLGIGLTASILTTSSGNYLSVSANATGATTLKLFDGSDTTGTNLLTTTNQGSDAEFHLNGIDIKQAGNVVNSVIPGATFTVVGETSGPVTLSLSSDRTQLSSALQDFVTKYNALMQEVNAQVGPAAGALSGDTVINQLQNVMRQITSYHSSTGSVQSLTDLGVEFSNTGVASFNSSTFNSLSDSQVADGFSFIGSATTGFGGFSSNLTAFSDPISGLIKVEQDGIDRTDQSIQSQIATLNDRISTMQNNLLLQLEAADAMQATLQSQQSQLSASLQGLSLVLYGKNATQLG